MRARIWIALLALTLSAGVSAAGVMVVVERALVPSTTSTGVAAGAETPAETAAPAPSEVPATAAVPGTLARTVLLPPAMTPVEPDAPASTGPTTCCSTHREQGPSPAPSQC